jgi:hypothetical protein
MVQAKLRRTFGTALDDPPETHITVISVLADGTQLVAHGIKGFEAARAHIKQRIQTHGAPGATTRYTRFIVVGTVGFANKLRFYDEKGGLYKEMIA